MSENLKPCPNPWCASTSAPLPANGRSGWRIVCACGVRTFSCAYYDDAITAWNTRARQAGEPKLVGWGLLNPDTGRYRNALCATREAAEDIASRRSDNYLTLEARPLFAQPPKADPDVVRLVEAAREGLICAEADLETLKQECEAAGEAPEGDELYPVYKGRRDQIKAALAPFSALGEG